MTTNNKIILRVKRDKINQWYYFGKWNLRLQLAWDPRRDWYWLEQYLEKVLWKEWRVEFMTNFTKVLQEMEKDNAEIFSLYEMPEIIKWEATSPNK